MLNTVYGALLADRRLQCRYRPLDAEEDKNYLVNPLGLVVRDAVTYLVCTLWDYDHPIQLALHRIGAAEFKSGLRIERENISTTSKPQNSQPHRKPAIEPVLSPQWLKDSPHRLAAR